MLKNSLSPRLLKGLDVYFPNFGFRNSDFEFAKRWAFVSSLPGGDDDGRCNA
jgi:hypothetical protein